MTNRVNHKQIFKLRQNEVMNSKNKLPFTLICQFLSRLIDLSLISENMTDILSLNAVCIIRCEVCVGFWVKW